MSSKVKILIKALVSLGLLAYLGYRMDLGRFWEVLKGARWEYVALSWLFYFGTVFICTFRWSVVLYDFQIRPPLKQLARITLIGYFFNLFLPSAIGGDFFRAYYLAKSQKRGMTTTLTTAALDRAFGLSALLLIGFVATAFYPLSVEGYSLLPIFMLVGLCFSVGIGAMFYSRFHRVVSRLLLRFGLEEVEAKFELVYAGLSQLSRNWRAISLVVLLSVGNQLLVVFSIWVGAMAIGINAPFHLFLIFIPIVNLATAIPLTINGVGVRESVYFLLFTQIGVAMENAVTLSLLNFMVIALTALPGGIAYSFYKRDEKFDLLLEETRSMRD